VNRINGGGIKNSNDQTNDENQTRETQTEDEFQRDFAHQWPEDKNQTSFHSRDAALAFLPEERATRAEINENTSRLIEFVKGVFPIFDEMLTYQTKNAITKDKNTTFPMFEDIINFPNELFSIFDDPKVVTAFDGGVNTQFVVFSVKLASQKGKYNISLIIQYTNSNPVNYFLCLSEVTAIYISINYKNVLIGGTKEGSIVLWDLRDSNLLHSKTGHDILAIIRAKETDEIKGKFIYRLPNYSTDFLGVEGHNSAVIKIKDVYSNRSIYEIHTLEEFGKVIVWNISELSKYELSQGMFDLGMQVDCRVKVIKTTEFLIDDFYFNDLRQSVICSDFDLDKMATK
jgi:hypothetical protein